MAEPTYAELAAAFRRTAKGFRRVSWMFAFVAVAELLSGVAYCLGRSWVLGSVALVAAALFTFLAVNMRRVSRMPDETARVYESMH